MRFGGWWRLWVIASILAGLVVVSSRWDIRDVYVNSTQATDAAAKAWAKTEGDRLGCGGLGSGTVSLTPLQKGVSVTVECTSGRQRMLSLLDAFLPAILLAILGLTIRWIYRGFRRP